MAIKAVYFSGRRTPVVVNANSRSQAISKARIAKKRGGNDVVSVRTLTGTEAKQARAGRWVRTGPKGEKPGKSNLKGYGPKPKK
ncbi:MAG: hypothetical protein AAF810_17335 [Cyanobacteria bacterium P01_D01_bin.36]